MSSVEQVIAAIADFSDEEKKRVFLALRDSHVVHAIESRWGVRADVILNAIDRGSDLTQRGIRGVIAESIFAIEVAPTMSDWKDSTPATGGLPFDVRLSKDTRNVRIQVKMQRREKGVPLIRKGAYVVEVQRTRTGRSGDALTRPYRFGEFDLIAVCMEPSTGDWRSFLYAPANALEPSALDQTAIATFQRVPKFFEGEEGIWSGNLKSALAAV